MKKQKVKKDKGILMKNNVRGITLIALVITIIVLLILAGVSIATLTGPNGLLFQANKAKIQTEEAQEKECLEIAVTSSQMEDVNTLKINKEKLENAIKQQFGNNKNFAVTDNKDGSFLVNINDAQRMYYIGETGKIIDQSKILKISTADELKVFRDDVNNGNTYEDWYIYLANDITLDINEEWIPIGLYPMENSTPDAQTNKPFKGTFDGRNHEINGMYINTTYKVQGFFGLVTGGKILNLGIGSECNISGNLSVGALAGYLYSGSKAINCYNKSNIKVGSYSGGVFGQLAINCNVENCYNIGNIIVNTNSLDIGGIAGVCNIDSNIKTSYNSGKIENDKVTNEQIGGISGNLSSNSTLEGCYNSGNIKGKSIIGGIVGNTYQSGIIKNCYNIGNIEGNDSIGGIIGELNSGGIYNCYNTGIISGNDKLGGIVGTNNIYNLTTVIIRNTYSLKGVCNNIYGYNGNGSVIEQSSIKTSDELKSLFPTLGNSFKEDISNINNGYPILNWQYAPTNDTK